MGIPHLRVRVGLIMAVVICSANGANLGRRSRTEHLLVGHPLSVEVHHVVD